MATDHEKLSSLFQSAQAFARAMEKVEGDLSFLDRVKSQREAAETELAAKSKQLAEMTTKLDEATGGWHKARQDHEREMAILSNTKGKELQDLEEKVVTVQAELHRNERTLATRRQEHDQVAASLQSLAKRLIGT